MYSTKKIKICKEKIQAIKLEFLLKIILNFYHKV